MALKPKKSRSARFLYSVAGAVMIALYCSAATAQAPLPSPEEMWAIIQEQSRMLEEQRSEIDALKLELGMVQANQEETENSVAEVQEVASQVRAAVVEAQLAAVEASMNTLNVDPLSETASTSGGWWDRTSIGGYGELHYQGGPVDRVDFHRFVLFLGHEFTNDIRFFSELEVEHALAGDGAPGEVELEQAYLQIDVNDRNRINAGLQLLPVGIINETHEPPTFFGVERNPVESNIIPSTWWEAGVGINGNFGMSGISYDLLASSEVSDRPSMTREETSKYTDPLADGTARQFSFVMDAKSIITFPAFPNLLPERGWWEITGLAWSGRGRITRVEVSTDGGGTWAPAQLQEPVLSKCTTRFRHIWNWDGGETVLMSRAIDETGYVQPDLETQMAARGAGTSYHYNTIRPWRVEGDGRVYFAQGEGA